MLFHKIAGFWIIVDFSSAKILLVVQNIDFGFCEIINAFFQDFITGKIIARYSVEISLLECEEFS